jgi:hypothetical protein
MAVLSLSVATAIAPSMPRAVAARVPGVPPGCKQIEAAATPSRRWMPAKSRRAAAR